MVCHFSIVQVHFVLLIEFNCTFSIYYKILTNYVYYYCILIRLVWAVGTAFFFRARFTSFHNHASLLTFFCYFVLFHSCGSNARVFGKTLVHEFLISYNHTEWYLFFFPTVQLQVNILYSERKSRYTCALVNLCL